ncbi:sphingomyelin synthase-related 1 isoform X2 [Tribolium madens]|uniref:sphingomyelin synthase-related 1 isoform X2 n=1 Tax=Tribolium madens TaxID=41895 RepID=UPI001CF754DF|nr:sphingomyelin synthase-related 1 isoform X2 [Tribolium madens]
MSDPPVMEWTVSDTEVWLRKEGFDDTVIKILCHENQLNGKCLLVLNEHDFAAEPLSSLTLRDRKCLYIACKTLQRDNQNVLIDLGILEIPNVNLYAPQQHFNKHDCSEYSESERISPPVSEDGRIPRLPPEKTKAFVSFCYVVGVTWITAFVMVIVHDRVPDMKKYPPLPDIFLDNVPHIPWAFDMCEITGTFLFSIWLVVLLFHKHSVPGAHLQCTPRNYPTQSSSLFGDLATKLSQAYVIWRGAGMSIQGVRTCGDYMFSGHTVALTMLNFFITEYTPRHIYYLHTLSWMMNMFGIFFILAAHEHYSIDVFVAFYISSRLFLYYHTLSNNQALMQRDSTRTKVWFPLFSYFESSVDGIVPNEYETPSEIVCSLVNFIKNKLSFLKDLLTVITVRSSETVTANHVVDPVRENKNK